MAGAGRGVADGVWWAAEITTVDFMDAQATGSGVAAGRVAAGDQNHDVGRFIGMNLIFRCDRISRCFMAMVLIISAISLLRQQ